MALTQTSIQRPIATSMVFLIVLLLGFAGFKYLPVDLLPPIEYPQLTISIDYPNVGPEEIEQIITQRVENTISGVPGLERVRSTSSEGRSRVTLEFAQGTDIAEAANDVRAAIDRIRNQLPPEADAPRIFKFDPNNFPIVIVGAKSTMNLAELTLVLDRDITKRFEQIPGVGSIDIWGGINREVQVDLRRDRLMASNLTSQQVEQALARENVNLPGGNVNEGVKSLYIRTKGEFISVEEIRNTIITIVEGKPIRVGDVADVNLGYSDLNRLVKIDGEPMLRFGLRKQTGANTVEVADAIRREVERVNRDRDDIELFVTTDQSEFIQASIDNVQSSALWGALFAILVLYVFLRNGSATFIISVSIPISIIATFGLLYFSGLSLNQMSFGGLALGVGLIVDNGIVVLENIIRLREQGKDLKSSALVGTKQVAGAIIASTLTTSVIFIPVVFMQTISSIMYRELAIVVVFALICSLLVALTLVPMLSSRFLTAKPESERTKKKNKFQVFFEKVEDRYGNLLSSALGHRKMVFLATAVLITGSAFLFPLIPVELAPQADADQIDIDLVMAEGTNIAVLNEYLKELETIVKATVPMEDVDHITTDIRDGRAEVELTMVPASERKKSTSKLADEIREQLSGTIPGADIRVNAQSGLWILRRIFGSGGNEAIQMELRGYDIEMADKIANDLKLLVETVSGVEGVRVGRREGRPEQNLVFDRDKISQLGLTVNQIAQVVQSNVGGSRAGAYRVGGDEFPIMVRLSPDDRLTAEDIGNVSLQLPNGQTVPLNSLVSRESGRGPNGIDRINNQRVVVISANLESGVPLGEAVNRIREKVQEYQLPETFSIVFGGEVEEQKAAAADFRFSIVLALILIYMVMAGQFERFIDPVIVMFSVPLALIGVVPTLLLTGTTINIQSLMGIIMLIGIVVNNAIVLVDYINLLRREEGMSVYEAVVASGRLRLRPILMTTLTTVLGLLPMSLGLGSGGEIQASLARVVIGGLTASTLVTLVFIPLVYVSITGLMEKVNLPAWMTFGSKESEMQPAEA